MPPDAEQAAFIAEAEALPVKDINLAAPKGWDPDSFFKQRTAHRTCLIWFALATSGASLALLIGVVIWQAVIRTTADPSFEVISDQGLSILAVSVLGQVIVVIYKITPSLWSNDEFKLMLKDK